MSSHTLLLIVSIHALALISPGPDFAVVTRYSIVSGRGAGLWAAAGVASSIGIYVLVSVLGMSLVLAALPGLSRILAVVGALYLAWIGVQCLRSKGQMPDAQAQQATHKTFVTGLLTNLLNPKAMLYFGSVLSQALTPDLAARDVALLWVVLVAESFLWFALVALLFSSKAVLGWLRTRLVWLDRVIGAVLIGLAARVALLAVR